MKKLGILLLSVVAFTLLVSCGGKATDSGSSSDKYGDGKLMALTFEANPSTGYDWQYEFKDGDAELVFDREDIIPNENGDIVGGNMKRTYYFRASKEGSKTLTFTYKRPWEGGETAYDIVYELTVDKNLVISCKNKKKGIVDSDKELEFFPDPVFSE